jgi:hypothetical protein
MLVANNVHASIEPQNSYMQHLVAEEKGTSEMCILKEKYFVFSGRFII